MIPLIIGAFATVTKDVPTGTGELGNKRTSGDHPNDSIVEIGQDSKKSPGDLRRLAVSQIPGRTCQLTIVWKTLKWVKWQHCWERPKSWDESWRLEETCCHSNSSEKPSANIDVKSSKGVNNNNNNIQTSTLLRMARLLRRVVETWGNLLQWKTIS